MKVNGERLLALLAAVALTGHADSAYPMKPEDGDFTNGVRVVLAGDDYESASVLLFGFEDLVDVLVEPSDLTGPGGAKITASEIDVKTVKVWYQQGTAWGGFFSDGRSRRGDLRAPLERASGNFRRIHAHCLRAAPEVAGAGA